MVYSLGEVNQAIVGMYAWSGVMITMSFVLLDTVKDSHGQAGGD